MRSKGLRSLVLAALSFLVLAGSAAAQAPAVIKYPGGPDVQAGGGNFVVPVNGTIRWAVVIDNSFGTQPLTVTYRDQVGTVPISGTPPLGCDGNTVCPGSQYLELLCSGADAPTPFPAGSTCDPATGRLNIVNIFVPVGAVSCVEFSTLVRLGAETAGLVGNVGCVDIPPPIGQTVVTRPTTDNAPTCRPNLPGAPTPGCSNVIVPNNVPPSFRADKPMPTYDDLDGDGVLSVGDSIHWTLDVTNDGTDVQTGFIFDPIAVGLRFVSIDLDPGGCFYDGALNEIQCPNLSFAVGETKRLQFTTEVRCALGSDDDSLNACNQASVCSDNDPRTNDCFLSDVDNALPVTPTCLDFPWTNYLGSTKSVAFDDRDGDGGLSAGDTLRYTIRVNNAGRKTGLGVSVVDTLDPSCMDFTTVSPGSGSFDPGLGTISWGVGDIPTGDTVQLSFSVDAVGTGPQCCNQAAINGREREACGMSAVLTDDPQQLGGARDATCIRFGPQPVLDVTKDFVLANDQGAPGLDDGDTLRWTITVTNAGGGPATSVALDDNLFICQEGFDPAAVTITGGGTNGSLPPNPPLSAGRVVVTDLGGPGGMAPAATVTVAYSTIYRGGAAGCCNQATVSYAEAADPVFSDDPLTPAAGDLTCTNRAVSPVTLGVTKTAADADGDGCFEPGEDVTFTITVDVSGGTATNLRITDDVTDVSNDITITDPGTGVVDPAAESITWTEGDQPDGARIVREWTGRIACDAPDGDTFRDDVTATSDAPATGSASLTSTVSSVVLAVTKDAAPIDTNGDGLLQPGERVRFTITVRNNGSCASGSATITDAIDPDLDATAATASDNGTVLGSTIQWDSATTPALGSIGVGGSVTVNFDAPALDPATNPAPGADGTVDNTANVSVRLDNPLCPDLTASASSAPLTIDTGAAGIVVVKSVTDSDGDGCIKPGESVTYTIDVTAGPAGARSAQLVDVENDPNNLIEFSSSPDGGTYDGPTQSVTWNLGDLGPNQAVTRTWLGTVSCNATDGDSVDDVATVLSLDGSGNDQLTTTVSVAELAVDKTVLHIDSNGNNVLDAGEFVSFSIAVSNVGSCASSGVVVTDDIDVDLDATTIAPSDAGNVAGSLVTWDPTTTPALGAIAPGATVTVTVGAAALDPATNPNPAHDSNVDNLANAAQAAAFGCAPNQAADALDAGRGEVLVIGGGAIELLRNGAIGCRPTAFATIDAETILAPGGINPAHAQTTAQPVGATGTVTMTGDATPRPADLCPEASPTGDGRVLVFYQLTDVTIGSLRVTKSGGDVLVAW